MKKGFPSTGVRSGKWDVLCRCENSLNVPFGIVCLGVKLLADFSESTYGRFEINVPKRQVSYVTYSVAYVNPLDAHNAVWIKWV